MTSEAWVKAGVHLMCEGLSGIDAKKLSSFLSKTTYTDVSCISFSLLLRAVPIASSLPSSLSSLTFRQRTSDSGNGRALVLANSKASSLVGLGFSLGANLPKWQPTAKGRRPDVDDTSYLFCFHRKDE